MLLVAGLLLIGLGAVYAADVQGVTQRAVEHAQKNSVFGQMNSVVGWINRPKVWRINGALMVVAGIAWIALALG